MIADKITKIATDISNAYTTLEQKGATIPENKNTENLAEAISSITGGGGLDWITELPDDELTNEIYEPSGNYNVNDIIFGEGHEYSDLIHTNPTFKEFFIFNGVEWKEFGNTKILLPQDSSSIFSGYENDVFEGRHYDTHLVTNMTGMFMENFYLTYINLRDWDTSNVTIMDGMFYACDLLDTLYLSGWDTSNVTSMVSMFDHCSMLTSLDLSNFDTSSVTNMRSMFFNCDMLTSLDLRNWNTSSVTNTDGMFARIPADCKILVSTQEMKDWVLGVRSDLTNVVVEGESATGTGIKTFASWSEASDSTGNNEGDLAYITGYELSSMSEVQSITYLCRYGERWSGKYDWIMLYKSKVVLPQDCSSLFDWNSDMDIDFISEYGNDVYENTYSFKNVTNTSSMFKDNMHVNVLGIDEEDLSKVTDMSHMFAGSIIAQLKLRNIKFNPDAITTGMFDDFTGTIYIEPGDTALRNWLLGIKSDLNIVEDSMYL